jgi:hypothetical protein
MDRPRRELIDHVAGRPNLCLLAPRGITGDTWCHPFIVDKPANDCVVSTESREANQVFPLWRFVAAAAEENISAEFRGFLDNRYAHHYGAEEVLGYIYAVLHAATYRTRYVSFLRIDFPRIPFPERQEDFEALSRLGWALVEAHLLRDSLPPRKLAAFAGMGDYRVEEVRREPNDGVVWINKTQGFRPVPDEVWQFRIGGHQVLDKYLKSRKGRVLTLDEIRHVARICDALAFTLEQMVLIEAVYRGAFPGQSGA